MAHIYVLAAETKFLVQTQNLIQAQAGPVSGHRYLKRRLKKKRIKLEQQKVSAIYFSNIAFDHYLWKIKRFSQLKPEKFSK